MSFMFSIPTCSRLLNGISFSMRCFLNLSNSLWLFVHSAGAEVGEECKTANLLQRSKTKGSQKAGDEHDQRLKTVGEGTV